MGYQKSTVLVVGLLAFALTLWSVPQEAEAQLCSKSKKGCVVKKDLKKNAVDSSRVKNNSLKSADIKDGTLTGVDVKNNSLTGADVKNDSLTGADVQDGGIEAADLTPDAESDVLGDLGCTIDQIARFIDGAWECVTGGGSYVFLSSTLTIDGGQGVAAMDALCQTDAEVQSLPAGTYRAWLSTNAFGAKDMLPPGPFYLPDGALLALSKADLLDGAILTPINVGPDGNPPSTGQTTVWTGTKLDGTHSGSDCDGWSTSSPISVGTVGRWAFQDERWTEDGPGFCSGTFHLYCIQVQ